MCVEWRSDWETAQEDIIAYKFVARADDGFRSPLSVDERASQDGRPVGAVLTYKFGKKTRSDEPGIYCISSPVTLEDKKQACLVVKIPKGTKYRRGKVHMDTVGGGSMELSTINALCVVPLREHQETYYYHHYTTASTSTTCGLTWQYVTSI